MSKKEDYDKLSLKQCEGKLTVLKKKLTQLNKATDKNSFEQAKKDKTNQIDKLKLQSAEIKWKIEGSEAKKSEVIRAQDERRKALKSSHESLQEYSASRRKATEVLKTSFGGRRIKNPQDHLANQKAELSEAQASLQTHDLSNNQERQLHRKIRDLKSSIAQTEKYMKDNVEDMFVDQDKKKQDMTKFMESHKETQAKFDSAKKNADALFESLTNLRNQRTDLADKIKALSEEKNKIISQYNSDMKKKNDVEREIGKCQSAIDDKRMEQTANKAQGQMRKEPKKQEVKRTPEAEAKGKKKEPEEEIKSLDQRRADAIAAWEAMQKEQKAAATMDQTVEAPLKQQEVEKVKVVTEDAKLCQTLIALCQNMKPKESDSPNKRKGKKKKKKKKIRLSHAPDTFSNFARLGVNIPMFTKDLDDTISALQQRMEECGNEENEV